MVDLNRSQIGAVQPDLQQLVWRYALSIDSRDIDLLASLFSKNTVINGVKGDAGVRAFWLEAWKGFRRSYHAITNHVIEVTSATEASGTVYCHAIHESHEGEWEDLYFAYFDRYVREGDQWYFRSRRISFWFREVNGKKVFPESGSLPERWPTWSTFWENVDQDNAGNTPS